MKVYSIYDEVRKQKGMRELTSYEYSFEMEEQARKRMRRYIRDGYKVEMKKDWWTTIEIRLVKEEGK